MWQTFSICLFLIRNLLDFSCPLCHHCPHSFSSVFPQMSVSSRRFLWQPWPLWTMCERHTKAEMSLCVCRRWYFNQCNWLGSILLTSASCWLLGNIYCGWRQLQLPFPSVCVGGGRQCLWLCVASPSPSRHWLQGFSLSRGRASSGHSTPDGSFQKDDF